MESRGDVNGDARPVCTSSSTTDENIEAVKKMILDNRRITIKEVADDVGISFGSCQAIFVEVLGMERLEDVDDARRCRRRAINEYPDLLKKVITGDES